MSDANKDYVDGCILPNSFATVAAFVASKNVFISIHQLRSPVASVKQLFVHKIPGAHGTSGSNAIARPRSIVVGTRRLSALEHGYPRTAGEIVCRISVSK